MLVECFVLKMKNTHTLSYKQCRRVLSIIFIAMIFKVITTKHIHFKEGEIQSIEGIQFSEGSFTVSHKLYNLSRAGGPRTFSNTAKFVFEKDKLSCLWDKYVETILDTV